MKEILSEKNISQTLPPVSRVLVAVGQLKSVSLNLSRVLDKLAGVVVVAIMVLVVSNVVMRALFNNPILGTYEYVGFFTAAAIALALAFCAVQDGHIAVDFVIERFPLQFRYYVETVVNILATLFFAWSTWGLLSYAADARNNGLVSPTTQTAVYPFIYIVAFGFFVMSIIQLTKLADSLNKGGRHNE